MTLWICCSKSHAYNCPRFTLGRDSGRRSSREIASSELDRAHLVSLRLVLVEQVLELDGRG